MPFYYSEEKITLLYSSDALLRHRDHKCSKTVNETAHQLPNAIVSRQSGKWDRNISMVWMCFTSHHLYSKRFLLAVKYVRVGNSKSSTLNSWTVILVVHRAVFYRHFYSPVTLFLLHLLDKLKWRFFEVCRWYGYIVSFLN